MEKSKVEGVGERWGWRRGRGRKKVEGKKGWEMEEGEEGKKTEGEGERGGRM